MWQSVGLTLLVIVATLVCALLFMLFGWYVVWQLFLSKFKFLRELVGDASTPRPTPRTRSPRASPSPSSAMATRRRSEPDPRPPGRDWPRPRSPRRPNEDETTKTKLMDGRVSSL
uniref:Small integral membrane protein 13 n=1 Tax=Neogobius melanostomus TaxID=47308 RepID=A0A8C6TLN0_9GOBI